MSPMDTKQRDAAPPRSALIRQLVDSLLEQRTRGGWPVSLTMTALAVRQQAAQCPMTNHELAELVAVRAVEQGHNVIFDADLLEHP